MSEVPKQRKSERIAHRWEALTTDVQTWLDVKIAIIGVELWAHVREDLKSNGVPVLVLLIGMQFLLIGGALGLGVLIGHPALGFTAVGVLMVLISVLLFLRRKQKENEKRRRDRIPVEGSDQVD